MMCESVCVKFHIIYVYEGEALEFWGISNGDLVLVKSWDKFNRAINGATEN